MDEESAKAVQEVAKASGKAIDAASKVGGFIGKVIGDATIEISGSLHDWAKYFRYKNLLRIKDKVEALHILRKLNGQSIPVPPRFAIPLLEAASEEDDDSIQSLWAGLIANATDPQRHLEPKKIFIEILSSLEPFDARLLQYLASQGWLMFQNVPGGGVTVSKLETALGVPKVDVQFSLQNLHRLGCVVDEYQPTWDELGSSSIGIRILNDKVIFRPSPLGFLLLEACDVVVSKG